MHKITFALVASVSALAAFYGTKRELGKIESVLTRNAA